MLFAYLLVCRVGIFRFDALMQSVFWEVLLANSCRSCFYVEKLGTSDRDRDKSAFLSS